MGRVHIINVVHTEQDWWLLPIAGAPERHGCSTIYGGLDRGVPVLLERFSQIEERTGSKIPITWCLWFSNGMVDDEGLPVPDILDQRTDFFLARMDQGDEIGIHPHAPDVADQWQFISGNARKLCEAGFPYPSTHVGGWFETNEKVIEQLETCDIGVDAGPVVRPGDGAPHGRPPDDHSSYRPYHPSRTNPWISGASPILRVPLFLSYHTIWDGAKEFIEMTRQQYERRDEVPVEIVHFFWHPFELIDKETGEPNLAVIDGYSDLFAEIGNWSEVVFSTTRDAVADWRQANGS